MATDEFLLDRIRNTLASFRITWTAKKMFGGYCFMVDDKMCFGTYKGGMMLRIDPDEAENLIAQTPAEQMIHGGKPMKGYLFLEPEGYDKDEELEFWIKKCLDFNPKAKSSKKKQ